jgi:hypothetical protein
MIIFILHQVPTDCLLLVDSHISSPYKNLPYISETPHNSPARRTHHHHIQNRVQKKSPNQKVTYGKQQRRADGSEKKIDEKEVHIHISK